MRFNALIPELSVSSIEASTIFYVDVLGFKVEYERKDDKFIYLSYGNAQIMLEQRNEHWTTGTLERPFGRGINLQIETEDAEGLCHAILLAKFQLFRNIYTVSYRENDTLHNMKEFLVQDPDGYLLRFSQAL